MGAYKTKTLFILAYSVSSFFDFICLFGFCFSLSGRNIRPFSSLLAYSDTPKTDFSLSGSILAYPVSVAYSVLQCKNTDVLIMLCATRKKFCCHSVAYSGIRSFVQYLYQKPSDVSIFSSDFYKILNMFWHFLWFLRFSYFWRFGFVVPFVARLPNNVSLFRQCQPIRFKF